jgi:hypothetical protein
MDALALLEVLDRDGHVRHSVSVANWPLRAGRAIDNDLVLDDPHVAPHHFSVDADHEGQVFITVGDTANGLLAGGQRLERAARVPVGDEALALIAGRTALRLRLATHPVPDELPLGVARSVRRELSSLVGLVVVAALLMAFETYLVTDPSLLTRALGSLAVSAVGFGLAWVGFLAVLSKVFTRQAHFAWHLRVMLCAVIVWQLIHGATNALAFMLSWPWISDFAFLGIYAVAGAALYFHMLAIEPSHPKRWRFVGASAAITGIALSLWFNHQATDRFGDELYMTHLLPPALRLAKPVTTEAFMKRLAPLQETLDGKAEKIDDDTGDDAEAADEE